MSVLYNNGMSIDIEHFSSVQLTVGSVLSADKMEGSDKMLSLSIDIGESEPRTILSGIAPHYDPGDLVGNRCVVVSNLLPRKMMGVESNGMLICATYEDEGGSECVRIIEPSSEIPVGSRLS